MSESVYRGTGVEHPPALFKYRGEQYPSYLRDGNAMRFAEPFAKQFCRGIGLDIGCGDWPLQGARPIDLKRGDDALALPNETFDFIASSHCLEHLPDYIAALEHWKSRIRPGGVLFLYLPSPAQRYWRPEFCRRHRHLFYPADMADTLRALGFVNVIHSERDLAWSFAVVGWNGETE